MKKIDAQPKRFPGPGSLDRLPLVGESPNQALPQDIVPDVVSSIPDGVVLLDEGRHVRFANPAAVALLAGTRCELRLGECFPLSVRTADPCEVRVETVEGEERILEVRLTSLTARLGDTSLVIMRNITTRLRIEDELRESRDRFELATKGANDGLWDWDIARGEVYYSDRWKAIIGGSLEPNLEAWMERVHPDDVETLEADIFGHRRGYTPCLVNEHRLLHRDGTYRWCLVRGLASRKDDWKAIRMAGSLTDITHRKHYEERILHQAYHDPLTGLPNRSTFIERLSLAVARAKREPSFSYAVVFCDLDDFKKINDRYGHPCGDRLLIEIGRRLQKGVRRRDCVARFAGDEFVVLLRDVADSESARRMAQRLLQALQMPCDLGGVVHQPSVSMGVAMKGNPSRRRPEDLIREADAAMYRAKEAGAGRIEML